MVGVKHGSPKRVAQGNANPRGASIDMFVLTISFPFLAVFCSELSVIAPPIKNLEIETSPEPTSDDKYGKQVTQEEVRSFSQSVGWSEKRVKWLQLHAMWKCAV